MFISLLPWCAVAVASPTMYLECQNPNPTSPPTNLLYRVNPDGTTTQLPTIGLAEGMALDANGNLFVSVGDQNKVDEITPAGVVSTFATDVPSPYGMAFGSDGDLYVCTGKTITQITPGGVVNPDYETLTYSATTIAFNHSPTPFLNSTGGVVVAVGTEEFHDTLGEEAVASFGVGPVVFGDDGTLYSSYQNLLRVVTPDGFESPYLRVLDNGTGCIALDGDGGFYFTTYGPAGVEDLGADGVISPVTVSGTNLTNAYYFAVSQVPEPSMIGLLLIGAADLAGRRR